MVMHVNLGINLKLVFYIINTSSQSASQYLPTRSQLKSSKQSSKLTFLNTVLDPRN